MKLRFGFVSNSSSSSFVIDSSKLTDVQISMVKNYHKIAEILKNDSEQGSKKSDQAIYEILQYIDYEWTIKVQKNSITGRTIMDNFDLEEFLKQMGIPAYAMTFNRD